MTSPMDFYQDHFQTYHDRTFAIDPASFLSPLVKHLSPGAEILDVGCGSGRDLKWLKKRGFGVTGFERSKGLAALARKHAGCRVLEGDFEVVDFSTFQVDALLMSGSLVHVSHERFAIVFAHIVRALKPGGRLLISLKQGRGSAVDDDGRRFFYWQEEELRAIFANQGFVVVAFDSNASMVNRRDTWLSFVLQDVIGAVKRDE